MTHWDALLAEIDADLARLTALRAYVAAKTGRPPPKALPPAAGGDDAATVRIRELLATGPRKITAIIQLTGLAERVVKNRLRDGPFVQEPGNRQNPWRLADPPPTTAD